MSIIRYRTPKFVTCSTRLSSLRDLLDSASYLAKTTPEGWRPPLEIFEDSERVTVRLEAPGLKKEDFDISLEDDVLTISGERRNEAEGTTYRSERFFGSFRRSVTLPSAVKGEAVQAAYQDGLLSITLPKAEETKPRKIQVNP